MVIKNKNKNTVRIGALLFGVAFFVQGGSLVFAEEGGEISQYKKNFYERWQLLMERQNNPENGNVFEKEMQNPGRMLQGTSENFIENGDFESGGLGWDFYDEADGGAAMDNLENVIVNNSETQDSKAAYINGYSPNTSFVSDIFSLPSIHSIVNTELNLNFDAKIGYDGGYCDNEDIEDLNHLMIYFQQDDF